MALSRKKRARRAPDVAIILTHGAETAARRAIERLLEGIVVEVRKLELAPDDPKSPGEKLLSLCDRAEVVLGLKEDLTRRKKRTP